MAQHARYVQLIVTVTMGLIIHVQQCLPPPLAHQIDLNAFVTLDINTMDGCVFHAQKIHMYHLWVR